jgi:hypothetical protein
MEMDLEKRLEEAKQTYKDMEVIETSPKIKEWYLLKQLNRIRRIEQMINPDVGGANSSASATLTQF